jgi:hypothetical protein
MVSGAVNKSVCGWWLDEVSEVLSRVGAIIGAANYAVQYDMNRDGVINAIDVALISPCVAAYGDVKLVYLQLVRR